MGSSRAALQAKDAGTDAVAPATVAAPRPLSATYDPGTFVQINPGVALGTVVGGGDASPWVVGTDASVYHYSNDLGVARAFLQEPNTPPDTTSIAVSPEGTPWRIDLNGTVWKDDSPGSGAWNPRPGLSAWEIGVGRNDQVWAISRNFCSGNDCPIFQWTAGAGWQQVPGAARHVAVAPDGTAYVTNHNGTIFKWVNGSWQQPFGGAACASNQATGDTLGRPVIGAGPNDAVWIVSCMQHASGNSVEYWSSQAQWWAEPSGGFNAVTLTVTADGTPWAIDNQSRIFEYHSTWQFVGPSGFNFAKHYGPTEEVNEIYTGELHDVDATPSSGAVTVAATAGGVWQTPPTLGWVSIGDTGAGVPDTSGSVFPHGPSNSVSTVTVKPGDQNTVVIGTGVPGRLNFPSRAQGNGIWVTHDANAAAVTWTQASIFDINHVPVDPTTLTVVKVRYSRDATKIYAITSPAPSASSPLSGLFVSTDDGLEFDQSPSSWCLPHSSADVFTDLVVDPQDASIAYIGVAGEGVYQATGGGANCNCNGNLRCWYPPPVHNGGIAATTQIALAISESSRLYVALAGAYNDPPNDTVDDFQGIDSTTTQSWGANSWNVEVPVLPGGQPGLRSQNFDPSPVKGGSHDWALGVSPDGTELFIGGVELYRGTGCGGAGGCQSFVHMYTPPDSVHSAGHNDYHAITWGPNGAIYVVNDGGIFSSLDGGYTFNDQMNVMGVTHEESVDVQGDDIFAAAWDVGGHFSTDRGTTWIGDQQISGGDAFQAIAAPAPNPTYPGYLCFDSRRFAWDGTQWAEIDSNQPSGNCQMAKGQAGSLFTTGGANDKDVMFSQVGTWTWSLYQSPRPQPPWSLAASPTEAFPTIYATEGATTLDVSISDNQWFTASPWPSGFQFSSNPSGVAAMAFDRSTSDLYLSGRSGTSPFLNPRIEMSPVGTHGQAWTPLTGTQTAIPGIPGMLKQDESVTTVAVDSSTRAVVVGTNGAGGTSTQYGDATVWRLNDADVLDDAKHHWRPWVNGLPNGHQQISWITGQYENGVFYYYMATWGRGIWKREARGGEL